MNYSVLFTVMAAAAAAGTALVRRRFLLVIDFLESEIMRELVLRNAVVVALGRRLALVDALLDVAGVLETAEMPSETECEGKTSNSITIGFFSACTAKNESCVSDRCKSSK